MVSRIYVEKKPGFDVEAQQLKGELTEILGIKGIEALRIINRYDVEGIDEELFRSCVPTVFSEPQVDVTYDELPASDGAVFAVEFLPGQFDQRADSASECVQLISQGERPAVRSAKVYMISGDLDDAAVEAIKHYVVNPVEARIASLDLPETLHMETPEPQPVEVLDGFRELDEAGLAAFIAERGLAMDEADIAFCQQYFRDEDRDPTITEIRVIDTYWSDHCRHTTFGTVLDDVKIDDAVVQQAFDRYMEMRHELGRDAKPVCLMDMGTIGAKYLKKTGVMTDVDESEEINACTVKVKVDVDGEDQDWLFLFKNETHNHPTEIEPFGGAATCVGGAIRDPLSGRSYVYQAMRVTGAGDPTVPVSETLEGKLPQRKLVTTAAAGYSSYGNQIGLATGQVNELYHPGYVAKRMEVGAVVGATPANHVRRECPAPTDKIILLGGRTGRDGIGGATGSSKSHNLESLDTMASEVQKGNAPEERKIQRLFRRGDVTRLIKRCNDFGAGGVSVAIGELADGLSISLDAVRKKYDGLDGTELAISESQERMAVVVAPQDAAAFIAAAESENLEAYQVAAVTEDPRMVMTWNGQTVASLSRAFLSSNGADKHITVTVPARKAHETELHPSRLAQLAAQLKLATQRGLGERFDGSIGAGSVLMPFGGTCQTSPAQAMAALFPVGPGHETDTCSVMAWGFDPDRMARDPFGGAQASVVESLARLVASGCDYRKAYLTFQEYFEKLRTDPERWGKPFQALLGALRAQLKLGVAAIGGKDSMSGSFLDLDVPPTLVSFAIAPAKAGEVISPEFKAGGHPVYLFQSVAYDDYDSLKKTWETFHDLCRAGKICSAWAVGSGGLAEGIMKMSFGNRIGFTAELSAESSLFYSGRCGAILAECDGPVPGGMLVGHTTDAASIFLGGESVTVDQLLAISEGVLEEVYPTRAGTPGKVEPISWTGRSPAVCAHKTARPRAVIPVFPGTNCEYDTAAACLRAGIEPEVLVVRNGGTEQLRESAQALEAAIRRSQMIVVPGGFSGGDEPDGSGKFIASFFRSGPITDAVHDLLKHRDGLMLGICNGFQALIKLGLVPYGEIRPMDDTCSTLTYNLLGRHQSRYVTTRVASVNSPWMLKSQVGDLHAIPVSHGEGRFVAPEGLLKDLIARGQVATQYVDAAGVPSMDITVNPNGSMEAVEGIFSPDGRVFGKMGHSERRGPWVARNIPGDKHQPLFESGAEYFR